MNIFINFQLTPATGWGNYGIQLAHGLLKRRHSVFAMAVDHTEQIHPLHRIRRDGIGNVGDWRAMSKALKHIRADFALNALGNGGAVVPYPEAITVDRHAAAIFFEDTEWTAEQLDMLRKFPVIICGSTWNADVLRSKGLTNLATVVQGVDEAHWHPAPRDHAFKGRFAVFSGGKLEFRKGQDIVVAAFRKFRAKHPDALLVTAWQNVWPETMQGIDLGGHAAGVPKITPEGRADILGWLEKNNIPNTAAIDCGLMANHSLANIVRACDVGVFPNRAEGGTNLVAMECVAAGVPTIAAMNTGQLDLREWVTPLDEQGDVPKTCKLYKGTEGWGETDVDALVDAMEQVYRNRDARRVEAERRAHVFLQRYSWQGAAIPKLLSVIEPEQAEAA